ncbi:MAG: sigma-70 family RNA polymerase sigma factor [Verrucomicrobiota bacterium]
MSDTDLELLQCYTRNNSQDSFATLVNRHLNLVFSAAMRQVRLPQLAEEVAQSVFADLAQSATKLKPDTILTAWLYEVTRRTAIDVVRRESRRQLREKVAHELTTMNATADDWTEIEPFLDEAMHALDATDRAAVLLRYFENKTLREVGETLGTSDDAAQKRVSRAVEKLREFFTKRGVTIGASGLVVVISANAVQAAPVGLAVAISTATLAGTTFLATATITKAIALTTLQKTLITATIIAAVGAGVYEARQVAQLREQNRTLQQQQAPLAEQIQQLQRERDDATKGLAGLLAENARFRSNPNQNEFLKLRGDVGVLQQKATELSRLKQDERLTFTTEDVFKVHQMHSSDAMGKIIEAVKKFSKIHSGEYPRDFDELKASVEISPTNLAGSLGFSDFVFLAPGTVDFEGTPLILRNRNPIINPRGESIWVYGLIDTNGNPSMHIMAAQYGN